MILNDITLFDAMRRRRSFMFVYFVPVVFVWLLSALVSIGWHPVDWTKARVLLFIVCKVSSFSYI